MAVGTFMLVNFAQLRLKATPHPAQEKFLCGVRRIVVKQLSKVIISQTTFLDTSAEARGHRERFSLIYQQTHGLLPLPE
jgi:hypothetical protein